MLSMEVPVGLILTKARVHVDPACPRVDRKQPHVEKDVDVGSQEKPAIRVMNPQVCVPVQVGSLQRDIRGRPHECTAGALVLEQLFSE